MFRVLLCLVCLTSGTTIAHAQPAKPPTPKDGPLGIKFVPLPKGTTYLGWNGEKGSAKKTEIKEDFEIAIHTVTQGQWQELMGNNPSFFSRNRGGKDKVKEIKDEDLKQFPVETVSWNDAQEFIKKLNKKEKGKGFLYRLPTEAEWEYACRGGATTEEECSYHFYFTKPTNDLASKQANCIGEKGTYLDRPTKVGSYTPNKLGLYDMHGNVWQWTDSPFSQDKTGSSVRVYRGGSWVHSVRDCQAAERNAGEPVIRLSYHGFRLVRVAVKESPAKEQPAKPAPKKNDAGRTTAIPFTLEFNPAKDIAILDRPTGKDGIFIRVRFTIVAKDGVAVGDAKSYKIRVYEDGRQTAEAAVQKINEPSEIVFESGRRRQDGLARTEELRLERINSVVESSSATVGSGTAAKPPTPKDGPLGMKFVPLPKATFYMGFGGDLGGKKTEIKDDFEIAIHSSAAATGKRSSTSARSRSRSCRPLRPRKKNRSSWPSGAPRMRLSSKAPWPRTGAGGSSLTNPVPTSCSKSRSTQGREGTLASWSLSPQTSRTECQFTGGTPIKLRREITASFTRTKTTPPGRGRKADTFSFNPTNNHLPSDSP